MLKKILRKSTYLLLAILLIASLAATSCNTNSNVTVTNTITTTITKTVTETADNPTTALPPEPIDKSFTVTDMMGAEVSFPDVPQTIATFGAMGVLNTFVECLGCGDRLCNKMTSNFESTKSYPHLRVEFAPQTVDAPLLVNANNEIIIEEVLKLKPDLCLTMVKATAEQLRKQGLTVIFLDWQDQTDVYEAVRLMGKVLGKEQLAEEYIAYFDNMVDKANKLTANLTEEQKKTALYGNITSYSQPHIIAEWWIPTAGGISVTNNGRPSSESYNFTLEDLLLWDPDVLFTSARAQIKELTTNPIYADLKAVKSGKIYCVPTVGHSWGNRTVEQPLSVFWAMNKLYPELVSDQQLSDEIYYFYDHFFNYQLSAEQLATFVEGK